MKNNNNPPQKEVQNTFYFGKKNYYLMLLGLLQIILGFVLMMGYGANTTPDGHFDAQYWNEDIFSIRRIRIAPLLVVTGFITQVVAILKRKS
ncbi:DUF3098 domain-containing protein [Riemerella columbina]|uniref:DUF3098 domain-containing protein n=1 Tax=Riemerella columbina TaxID=103810 RepID=UPI00266F923C|nr:DUF3098 domain-containing protein [Riemerella columbina]WKS95859.1 DUF3098 domain-containing protein [Riemerella columbina]